MARRTPLHGILLLLLAALFVGCGDDTSVGVRSGADTGTVTDTDPDDDSPVVETRSYRMGVSGLVPRNWPEPSNEDWSDLFAKVPLYGGLWGVHTGWNEGEADEDGVPVVVEVAYQAMSQAASESVPYVALGVEPDGLTGAEADTYFEEHGQAFIDVCAAIARTYQPEVFLIGVEINRFYEKSPAGFDHFVDVYADAYAVIKAESPTTEVGSNFMLEYMRGAGERSGANHEPHFHLLERFESQADLVSFTVYPFFDYDRPGDVPADYLDVITEHTELPVMITETGWPSEPVAGISGSEGEQVAYLEALAEMAERIPTKAIVWAFPHDIETGIAGGLFDHISLRRNDGSAKEAFSAWRALNQMPIQ